MRNEMKAVFHVVDTPDGPDLQVGEEDDPSAVRITFHVPVSRVIDGTPELRALVSTLTRERDEARAEVEELRTRTAAQLEIETQARDAARADAARMRHALEEATRALAVDPRFLSPARLETARSILAAALAGEGEAPSCAWTMDEDGVWHTGCGASWIYFPGGTPDEHGQRFCHACGKSIAAAAGLDDEGRPSP